MARSFRAPRNRQIYETMRKSPPLTEQPNDALVRAYWIGFANPYADFRSALPGSAYYAAWAAGVDNALVERG